MRSLFLRIFVWFWLAAGFLVAIIVLSSPYWTRVRPAMVEWEQRTFSRLTVESERVATILAEEGVAPLQDADWRMRGRARRGSPQVFLFRAGNLDFDMAGRRVPPIGAKLVAAAAASGDIHLSRDGSFFLIARPVTTAGGEPLIMLLTSASFEPQGVQAFSGRTPNSIEILEAQVVLPRLLVILLAVGAFCYWLSKYLSLPLERLRLATRGLAAGDLSVRVSPRVVSRRDEIGDLARDFDTMAERVEQLIDAKKRLLRDVSHELRSPLARLDVALELARDPGDSGVEPYLDRIARESERLNELIGSLLELTRVEGGGAESRVLVDLQRLVAEVVEDAGFEAEGKQCVVSFEVRAPAEIMGVPELLRSAVDNLLRNAVRHTAPGSAVEVTLGTDDDQAVVSVRDHGPGVPEDELPRIFEPFVRVGEDRDRASGGAGLGLAIAKRAIAVHGGSLRAENHPQGGLVLEIRLPREIDRRFAATD